MKKHKKIEEKPLRKFIGTNLPLDVYDALCYEAAAAERSVSAQILFIIRQSLSKNLVVK